jgi:hypothetical protein
MEHHVPPYLCMVPLDFGSGMISLVYSIDEQEIHGLYVNFKAVAHSKSEISAL